MQSQIHELIVSLQKEYLFIYNEKMEINKLFNNIQSIYEELYRKKYILNSQQLINIEFHSETLMLEHIKNFFMLESKINFSKFGSVYNQYEQIIIELFKFLSNDCQLLTEILLFVDDKSLNTLKFSSIIYKSILGSAISNSDNNKIISILINLTEKQFSTCSEPQKIIHGEKCAFIRLFRFYIDNSLSAKTFLIATLQEPIEYILMNDESYFDINSKISLERLTHIEKLKLLGDPKSNTKYHQNILAFRNNILNKIAEAVNMFVKKLTESFILLPQNYIIVVNNLYKTLTNNPNIKKVDVLRTCIDFIFDCFIYPAMLSPDSHGIIGDFPLSSVSKHNLMEIGKVIKSLIYGEINKVHNVSSLEFNTPVSLPSDLLEKFENYSLSLLLTELSIWSESTISNVDIDSDEKPESTMDLNRSVVLISETDLYFLLKILKCFILESTVEHSQLIVILDRMKQLDGNNNLKSCLKNSETTNFLLSLKEELNASKFYFKPEEMDSLNQNSVNNNNDLNVFILIVSQFIECPGMKSEEKVIKELKCHCDNSNDARKSYNCVFHNERSSRKQNTDNSISSLGHRSSRRGSSSSRSCVSSGETSSSCRKLKEIFTDKVITSSVKQEESIKISFVASESGKRKTHFNESNDQESTGATSDIVEGISEVASTHSAQSEDIDSRIDIDENNEQSQNVLIENNVVETITNLTNDATDVADSNENAIITQSTGSGDREQAVVNDIVQSTTGSVVLNSSIIDLEDLRTGGGIDDGSSDLVYWPNMSGRDTPSMSGGRESPSSSVGGSDLPNNIKPDVTEKFWKFDIPKTVEARSTVSDTWSTDVLASDSETTEQPDNSRRLVEIREENPPTNQSLLASGSDENIEVVDLSVRISSSNNTSDKHEQMISKSLFGASKTTKFQHESTDTLTTSDPVLIPNILLESTLTNNVFTKTKTGPFSRANIISGRGTRNTNTLTYVLKEEEKPRSYSTSDNCTTGSPISTHRGLVHKIRDKFAGNRNRRDLKNLKLDGCDNKPSVVDEVGKNIEKQAKVESSDLSESVEQMLRRYDKKCAPKTPDFATILSNNVEDQSSVPPFFDLKTPPEGWPAWKVAKRNLRMIFEKHHIKSSYENLLFLNRLNNDTHPLIRLLRLYLAEANLLQNHFMITRLEEAIRVVQLFDNESLSRMISSMLKEWKQRKAYIAYLVNTHVELRLIKKRAEEYLLRCQRSCQVTSRSMISYCVHQILRQQSQKFEEFYKKFSVINNCDNSNNSCLLKSEDYDPVNSTGDESMSRAQLVADMLDWASRILNSQPYVTAMTSERQQETRLYLERIVMSQLHRSSIILNDDIAEIDRDNVFHRELELLQKVVSPSQLSINKKFNSLLPFEVAQKELLKINCYKTPHDKVSCIEKTTHKIAILLKMINSDMIPGADDILPVLIYVIIMANPPRLLSNMSFIELLCSNQLEGQNQYMWCQFSAAVNEVKRLLTVLPRYKK